MSTAAFITTLAAKGVEIWAEGDRLRLRAPQSALPDALMAEIKARKDELLAWLRTQAEGATGTPLSQAQLSIWNAYRAAPRSPAYNVNGLLELRRDVRQDLLEQALREVIEGHPGLRCLFRIGEDGAPAQFAQPASALEIATVALSGDNAAQQAWIASEIDRPFILEEALPARFIVLHATDAAPRLLFVIHHIAIDFQAAGLLLSEVNACYQALCGRQAPAPTPESMTLRSFVERERAQLDDPGIESEFAKVQAWLDDDDAKIVLPADSGWSGPGSAATGQTCEFAISPSLEKQLRAFGRQHQATPYAVLLTVYTALLARLARKAAVRIGIPTSGREQEGSEHLIANLVNLMPYTVAVDPVADLAGSVRAARARLAEVRAHQHLPYEALVRRYARGREAGHSPFFDILFNWNKVALELGEGSVFTGFLQGSSTGHSGATHHLALSIVEQSDGMRCLWTYGGQRFNARTIESLGQAFLTLLEQWLEAADKPLHAIPIMRREAVGESLEGAWRGEPQPCDGRTVADRCAAAAAAHPDALALCEEERSLTQAELHARSTRWALALAARGVAAGDLVLLPLPRGADFVCACLAVWKTGAAFVPLSEQLPDDRLAYIALEACARHAIVARPDAPAAAVLGDEGRSIIDIASLDAESAPESGTAAPSMPSPDHLAYVIYTSGSTGRPKGVLVSHRGLANYVEWQARHDGLDHRTASLQTGSIAFDASMIEIWPALSRGGSVVFAPDDVVAVPSRLPAFCTERAINWIWLITPIYESVSSDAWRSIPGLKNMVVGGERLRLRPPPGVRLHNAYGPTEATVFMTCGEVQASGNELPGIGRPIDNVTVLLTDPFGQAVPQGCQGEIVIASPGLAWGYLGDARKTADAFRPHPCSSVPGERVYLTGDLGRRDAQQNLEFLGRVDRQVKMRGFRIEPGEIEHQMLACDGVHACRVLLSAEGSRLLAFFCGPAAPSELRSRLESVLPAYMVPASFVVVDELPRTATGKLDDARLLDLADSDIERPLREAGTPTEAALLTIWRDVLGRDDIGVDDDFFTAGGHSLTAAHVIEQVRGVLGQDLAMSALLANSSVAALARWIDASVPSPASGQAAALVADGGNRHQPFPLTDVQHAYWAGRASGFELGNTATHIYTEQELAEFDTEEVDRIWNLLIQRHDMLRAVVSADGMQRILPEVPPYRIEVADLSGLDETSRERHLMDVRQRMSHQVFDPQRWPMFEIRVSKLADSRYRLHTSIDALIADARSFGLLEAEYEAIAAGLEDTLPVLDIGFRDYVLAERRARDGVQYEAAREYWLRRLADFPAAPQLPLARDPGEVSKPIFVRREGCIEAGQWARLRDKARELRATPSTLLLTAFAEVLGQWSAEPRFGLNLTLFNRQPLHRDVEHLVGDFTSLTLLEIETGDGRSFAERVAGSQARLWQDMEHRSFTGVEVLRELAKRQGGRSTGMPVVFTSILPLDGESGGNGAGSQPDFAITQTSQVWIDHVVEQREGAVHFHWDVVEELFPQGMLDVMFDAYRALLADLADHDEIWHTDRPLALPPAQATARAAYNDTRQPVPAGKIYEAVLEQARRTPDAIAVVDGDVRLSYADMAGLAIALSQQLRALGAGPGQRVAIEMHKGWEQVVAALAVTLAGAAYLPIDAHLPSARRRQLLEQGGARLSLIQDRQACENVDGIVQVPVRRVPVAADLPFVPHPDLTDQDLAYVIFTSGSTGVPKGVMIDHRSVVNTLVDINERFAVDASDVVLGLSSLSFDLSVYDIFGALGAGATLVIPDDSQVRDPQEWGPLLGRHGVTIVNAVPSFLQMLLDYADTGAAIDAATLRLVMMSGDWIPLPLTARVRALAPACRVVSLGGATEAAIWSIWHDIGHVEPGWRSIPYGQPLRNQQIHVLHRNGAPCPDWVVGDLYIGGSGLAQGYWADDDKTAASFIRHPETNERLYRTGDLGRFVPRGWVEFLGRADSQVKVQGHRIELAEIEAHLADHPSVREVAVAVKGEGDARGLVAYVVPAHARARELATEAARSAVDFAVEAALAEGDPGYIEDPTDRLLFKFARHGLRRVPGHGEPLALRQAPTLPVSVGTTGIGGRAPDFDGISQLLSALRAHPQQGSPLPKYHYPSAGSLYPLQAHVLVGAGLGVPSGTYYYDPDSHALVRLADQAPADGMIECVLVADLAAIEPLYGPLAQGFCAIEAGYVESLLGAAAVALGYRLEGAVIVQERHADWRARLQLGGRQVPLLHVGIGAGTDSRDSAPATTIQALSPLARQSHRTYLERSLRREELLDLLSIEPLDGFDLLVYVRQEGVEDCAPGLYRAAPGPAGLQRLCGEADDAVRQAFTAENIALYDQSRVVILICGPARTLPALRVAGRAAGDVTLRAASGELGTCAIGHLREDRLHASLPPLLGRALMHALVVGAVSAEQKTRWQSAEKPNTEQALSRQLDAHLRDRLPEYMAPRVYMVIDALPLNSNNKVNRAALPAPDQQALSARAYEAPRDEQEQMIAAVWAELLGLERVGRNDNFFALGGNSVLIVQMFGRLSAQSSVELNVADLFAYVTVADLAAHLRKAGSAHVATSDADLRAAQRRQARPRERRGSSSAQSA